MTDVEQIILDKIKELNTKMDLIMSGGCAKASAHDAIGHNQGEIFKRLSKVESVQAESRGKLAVAIMVVSASLGAIFGWIGKQTL